MTIEEIKKLDKSAQKIQYPFGESYPTFHKIFKDAATERGIPVSEVIKQYSEWKSNKE